MFLFWDRFSCWDWGLQSAGKMPKVKPTQGGMKQATISKFFTLKQGPTKLPNGVQTVTDENEINGHEVMSYEVLILMWMRSMEMR